MEDQRFKHISSDAKFRRIPKKEQKVKIDNRFQSMFNDEKFKEEYTVDRRGRPIKHSSTQDLKRYYHLSSSEESSSERNDHDTDNACRNDLKKVYIDDKKVSSKVKKKLKNLKVNYARGEDTLFSDSSSDENVSEDELDEDESVEHKWGELDAGADTTEKITHRLAVCNMDWDRIHAVDILVLLNSFLPPGGTIQNATIYLSEFGKKRLAEEDISGPTELRESRLEGDDEETEEGSKYHMEKLRQYQLNRLKYYYAVVIFSDANAANKVYTECDGMEYESSATKMDLRFIPDDMIFDEEPKEICDKMPEINKYQPRFFITTALQQAKVDLTWDETNPDRIELAQKLNSGKTDVEEAELQNILALGSEDESDNENSIPNKMECANPVEKYRALLQDIEEKEKEKQNKEIQMEVTWGLETEKKTQELVRKKLAEKEQKTPFQQYLDKRKVKRKEKKKLKKLGNENKSENDDSDIPSDIDMNDQYFAEEFNISDFTQKKDKKKKLIETSRYNELDEQKQAELELLLMNNETDERKHFNLKTIIEREDLKKSKKRKGEVNKSNDDFEVNASDARFSAIFSKNDYSIDPSDPHYKNTKGMEILINEKLKRKYEGESELVPRKKNKVEKEQIKNKEMSILVKHVKRNTVAKNKNK